MSKTDDLYSLVLSLTKSEKRYFTLQSQLQSPNSVYQRLFEIIVQERGRDVAVRVQFNREFNSSQFESARKYLYQSLLKSLRLYAADSSLDARLMARIEEAEILFSRGIATGALAQLQTVREEATQYERFIILHWVCSLELNFLTELAFSELSEESLIKQQEQINTNLQKLALNQQHAFLNQLLLFRYFHQGPTRSRTDDERLQDLLLQEHHINAKPHVSSLESGKLHLHFQATYFLMIGKYKDSLAAYVELEALLEQSPASGEQSPRYYVYLVDGILTGLKSIRNYEAMQSSINHLQRIARRNGPHSPWLDELITSHQVGLLIEQKKFGEAQALFDQYIGKSPSVTNALITTHSRASLLFLGILAHYYQLNFRSSLSLINNLLAFHPSTMSRNLYATVRLFDIILHMEAVGTDHLLFKIKSVERKLSNMKRLFSTEKLLLSILRQSVRHTWHHPKLLTLLSQLKQETTTPYGHHVNDLFDFVSWIEARVPLPKKLK